MQARLIRNLKKTRPNGAAAGMAIGPARWNLWRTLKGSGPLSIYALAKALKRNYSNVHSDVVKLLAPGWSEKTNKGACLSRGMKSMPISR